MGRNPKTGRAKMLLVEDLQVELGDKQILRDIDLEIHQ
jgi:Fe-S cluster assembly ATPase SufC